jgi:hypothetical protein
MHVILDRFSTLLAPDYHDSPENKLCVNAVKRSGTKTGLLMMPHSSY